MYLGQLPARHMLAARQLQRDLKVVGVHIVEVLHASGDVVPRGAVGDAAGEGTLAAVAALRFRFDKE